ncbi:GTPase of the mitochondrial inner membrane that associates with the large ribosomal subunit [Vanrija albida]|uniref:GTPase of the mitochondrial inner membrane that associates with the large ribosomal subunit n=1 Tax=Vanrija albida TaxID=181172 RepID=A0ABR3Q2R6_9TREE
MAALAPCRACLRSVTFVTGASAPLLRPPRLPAQIITRAASSKPDPEPYHINEEEDEFDDVVGEIKRRRKRMADKRNRQGGDFVDFLKVYIRGGKGGSGTAAFMPTKKGTGPPSGGNGGPGGNVYIKTSPHISSLSTVSKRSVGGQGGNGAGNLRHGSRGDDVTIVVPIGTVIREVHREGEAEKNWADENAMGLDREERRERARERWLVKHPNFEASPRDIREAEAVLKEGGRWTQRTPSFEDEPALELDIAEPIDQPLLLARGGGGGLGNTHFVSPSTRHPRLASRGVIPPSRTFEFELKLLADVGLVGLPNAGKSTLLRAMTGRRAEVADYAFTTLHPQIGVVRVLNDGTWAAEQDTPIEETELERMLDAEARMKGEYQPLPRAPRARDRRCQERIRFTVSDNPGLLARASENVGLGHSFLRSIERSLALSYVLDGRRAEPADDLRVLHKELEAYKPGLAARARIIALNKTDGQEDDVVAEKVESLKRAAGEIAQAHGTAPPVVLVVSAKFGTGMDKLVNLLADAVGTARQRIEDARPKPRAVEEVKDEEPEQEADLF